MTNKLEKLQKVLMFRNGLQIWLDKEKAEAIENDWVNGKVNGPFKIDGRTFNTADLTAIVPPADIEDLTRRKNGQWKCTKGQWHERGAKCDCPAIEEVERSKAWKEAVAKCGKCQDGWLHYKLYGQDAVRKCDCILNIK